MEVYPEHPVLKSDLTLPQTTHSRYPALLSSFQSIHHLLIHSMMSFLMRFVFLFFNLPPPDENVSSKRVRTYVCFISKWISRLEQYLGCESLGQYLVNDWSALATRTSHRAISLAPVNHAQRPTLVLKRVSRIWGPASSRHGAGHRHRPAC